MPEHEIWQLMKLGPSVARCGHEVPKILICGTCLRCQTCCQLGSGDWLCAERMRLRYKLAAAQRSKNDVRQDEGA